MLGVEFGILSGAVFVIASRLGFCNAFEAAGTTAFEAAYTGITMGMTKAFSFRIVRVGLIVPPGIAVTAARRDGTGSAFKLDFETALGATPGVEYCARSGFAFVFAS
jgi:hypothetical protein